MAGALYPRMAYHENHPKVSCQIVRTRDEDERLGAGWDDPYGVRAPAVCSDVIEQAAAISAFKRPGRPRKDKV